MALSKQQRIALLRQQGDKHAADILASGGRDRQAAKVAEKARKGVEGVVSAGATTVRQGDSFFSIAAQLTGFDSGDPRIAAFAEELARANGGLRTLQPGQTLRVPNAVVGRDATPSQRFMSLASGGGSSPVQDSASEQVENAQQTTTQVTNPEGLQTLGGDRTNARLTPQQQRLFGILNPNQSFGRTTPTYNVQGIQSQAGVDVTGGRTNVFSDFANALGGTIAGGFDALANTIRGEPGGIADAVQGDQGLRGGGGQPSGGAGEGRRFSSGALGEASGRSNEPIQASLDGDVRPRTQQQLQDVEEARLAGQAILTYIESAQQGEADRNLLPQTISSVALDLVSGSMGQVLGIPSENMVDFAQAIGYLPSEQAGVWKAYNGSTANGGSSSGDLFGTGISTRGPRGVSTFGTGRTDRLNTVGGRLGAGGGGRRGVGGGSFGTSRAGLTNFRTDFG